jgi:hypothetical protein
MKEEEATFRNQYCRFELTEMSKLYDKSFKIGFCLNVLLFIFFNFLSYLSAYESHQQYLNRKIKMAPVFGFPNWGFPFGWNETFPNLMFVYGGMLNFLIMIFGGFILGFLLKPIFSEILSRRTESK